MFKSYRTFTLDPTNTKRLKVLHTKVRGHAYTIVRLHDTDVVKRQNVNNVVTLNSGGWLTMSTKTVINTALRLIYGDETPYVFQKKNKWFIQMPDGSVANYRDGIILGGGSGAPFMILN